jgi:hydrogenase-4 component B
MVVLSLLCAFLGLAPGAVLPLIDRAVAAWNPTEVQPGSALSILFPATWITAAGAAILGLSGLAIAISLRLMRTRTIGIVGTWDCGYSRPDSRMEYTASSFGHSIRGLFRWALWPSVQRPQITGPFAGASQFRSPVQDPVLDRMVLPGAEFLGRTFAWLRLLQQGRLQIYVLYFFAIVVVLLVWGRSIR